MKVRFFREILSFLRQKAIPRGKTSKYHKKRISIKIEKIFLSLVKVSMPDPDFSQAFEINHFCLP